MHAIKFEPNKFQKTLLEEQFRLWDAIRNDCSTNIIEDIKESIKDAKADMIALEIFFQQSILS
ncbi:MAG: hypothetical protein JWQ96_1852 [Segetibacter sp.]|nr:hypothetical protein [Segetibacter sp.]